MQKPMTSFELEIERNKTKIINENYKTSLMNSAILGISVAMLGSAALRIMVSDFDGIIFFLLMIFIISNYIGISLMFKRILFGNILLDGFEFIPNCLTNEICEIVRNPLMLDWKEYVEQVHGMNRTLCRSEAKQIQQDYLERVCNSNN